VSSAVSPREESLGDFTMSADVVRLIALAAGIGAISAAIALVLLNLIGLVTNLLYYGRLSTALVSPAMNRLGPLSIALPVIGGLVIGLMARFGSERIRGHGIPEAMETILVGGSKVQPRLAVLKPVSSAISIGSGGPFGAEGPIILTGGAVGSLVGQFVHLAAAERKTLLVAGASAGMAAVFGTPMAAVLLAVELLLFELKPRSLIPVATAVAVAAAVRIVFADRGLIAPLPLFPTPAHPVPTESDLVSALAIGIAGGCLAWLLTVAVYGAEDLFKRLPIHWMWWPAIGGLVVGIGGLIEPRALGVGYDSIADVLSGRLAAEALVSLLLVKLVIWSVALGSGTSGGILAPLLLIGGAMGALLGTLLPGGSVALWALLGMAATMAGVMRSPLTSIVFAFELTHDQQALLPLLLACVTAHAVSVLVLRRSILTEKVARRGFHVMREYGVEPLEALFARDVMATHVLTVEPTRLAADFASQLEAARTHGRQRLYPVVSSTGRVIGVVGRRELERAVAGGMAADGDEAAGRPLTVGAIMSTRFVTAFPDETLRMVADRMAAQRIGAMPVIDRQGNLRGLLSQYDLLRSRDRYIQEERHRERVLRVRPIPGIGRGSRAPADTPPPTPGVAGPAAGQ
jgi:chloride channel protein, CIC family